MIPDTPPGSTHTDPRAAYAMPGPDRPDGAEDTMLLRAAPAAPDTLTIPANADHWLELMHVLAETGVPQTPGDSQAMRQVAKLDPETFQAVLRWIRAAHAPATRP